jgi:hypothetical protein
VVAIEGSGGLLLPRRVDLAAIEFPAFFEIGEKVVRAGDRLERVLGFRVAGIEVGMVLLRQLEIGGPDRVLRGVSRHAERLIGILQDARLPSSWLKRGDIDLRDSRLSRRHTSRADAIQAQGSETTQIHLMSANTEDLPVAMGVAKIRLAMAANK